MSEERELSRRKRHRGLSGMRPIFQEEISRPRRVVKKQVAAIMKDPERREKSVDRLLAEANRITRSRVRARRNEQAYLEGERRAAQDWRIWFEPLI